MRNKIDWADIAKYAGAFFIVVGFTILLIGTWVLKYNRSLVEADWHNVAHEYQAYLELTRDMATVAHSGNLISEIDQNHINNNLNIASVALEDKGMISSTRVEFIQTVFSGIDEDRLRIQRLIESDPGVRTHPAYVHTKSAFVKNRTVASYMRGQFNYKAQVFNNRLDDIRFWGAFSADEIPILEGDFPNMPLSEIAYPINY